ncbi:MAG: hypothetical protein WDN04_04615 [Rhodospirillales bacterium]
MQVHAGPTGLPHDQVRRILAVKLDHIGDYLTAVPALRAIRQRFPLARLALLAPPATAALARHEASVDEVIEFTFFHARSAEGARGVSDDELAALGARLGPEKFDIAIDLRMQPETRAVLRHCGARVLIGYDQAGRYPWLDVALEWEGDLRLLPKHEHISDRLLTLVGAMENACRTLPRGAPDATGRSTQGRLTGRTTRLVPRQAAGLHAPRRRQPGAPMARRLVRGPDRPARRRTRRQRGADRAAATNR